MDRMNRFLKNLVLRALKRRSELFVLDDFGYKFDWELEINVK